MSDRYAYQVDNGRVVNGIVTDGINTHAQWAIENLGGVWVNSDTPAWIGGTWTEQEGFRPPQPSPDCWWENGQWVCPEPTFTDE